jgi:hypothetical protein
MKCHYCDKNGDLRPYGPDCAMVCFECAMKTPERAHFTGLVYMAQMEMVKGAVVIGTEAGPYPFQLEQPQ